MLEAAIRRLDDHGMWLHRTLASRCLGMLKDDAMASRATAELQEAGLKNPDAMTRVMLPGRWSSD